jgi:hypothetical protein
MYGQSKQIGTEHNPNYHFGVPSISVVIVVEF